MKEIQKIRIKTKLKNNLYKSINIFNVIIIILTIFSCIFVLINKKHIEKQINCCDRIENVITNELTVYYLDVGQGDCCFISFPK